MTLGLIIKFFATMMDLMIPYVLEVILDDIVPQNDIKLIVTWGVIMLLCAAASVTTNITANRMATKSAGKVTKKLRHDLFRRISYLSSAQTDSFTESTLISRITSDTYNVNQMLTRVQRLGVRGPILLIGGIIFTLSLDAPLTLVLIGMLPLIAVVVYTVTKLSIPLYTKCQAFLDRLVRVVQENATGVRIIKALSKSEHERKRFSEANASLSEEERRVGILMAITNPTTTLVLNVGLTLIVLIGAHRADSGLTETGTIIAFLSYFTIIIGAMLGITRIFIVCSKGVASANRISEVLNTPDGYPILPEDACERSNPEYRLAFEDVSFSYNKVENNLTDIDYALKPGDTLGIIGATGSGKTTIVNLVLRFYDPDKGRVLVDGRDIRTIPLDELRNRIGIAMQNDFIMAGSIRENIDFKRGLDDDAILKAAEIAQATGFISRRPEGLDYMLTARGGNLSGGQKQRLLIARAVAAQPDVLILDDSSSALDYKTDADLRKTLSKHFPNMTTIIVAQRISSIMNADCILMLDDGEIIGKGTHSELLNNCGLYKSISDAQMGGGLNA